MLGSILNDVMKPQAIETSRRLQDALMHSMSEERKDQTPHEGMWFRSSGLYRLCPRSLQLGRDHGVNLAIKVDPKLRWIFGSGTAIHTQFQQDYLPTLGSVFQGWWRRVEPDATERQVKGERIEGGSLSHKWCSRPEGAGWQYEELEFRNEEYRLTGHCDGVLVWGEGDIEALELKTISSRGYESIDPALGGRPKGEHIIQVQAYMWLMGLDRARIVYINKDLNTLFPQGLCEHVVNRDEAQIKLIQGMLRDCATAADLGLEAPLFERLPECGKKSDARAKDCAARNECFPRRGG
jgi:hypothetical protein